MKKSLSPAVKFLKSVHIGFIVVVLLLLAVIVVRVALPGIVKNYVNNKLNELPGYTGQVEDIDIHLLRGAYVIKGLHLKKKSDPDQYPFLAIRRADLSLEWGTLFKGRLVGIVVLEQPVVNILTTEEISKEPSKESWTKTVKALMPMTINRLQVNGGSFAYRDLDKKPPTNLHIDRMQLTALNLANVEKAADPLPSQVNLTGTSIGDGHLKLAMKVNVLKELPDFDMGMELTGANLLSLNGFFEANAKMDIERGGIDIFSKLTLKDGEMEGYVKPFIKDLKVLDAKKDIKKKGGVLRVVKKAVVGLFAKAVTNPKTKKIATVIPIKGNVKDPKTSGWATFVGILKNAFVQAFHESLSNELKSKEPAAEEKIIVKIASYNINGINGRLSNLLRWLSEEKPDVVCLQELKCPDDLFPERALSGMGYQAIWQGQKSWNGVAILSRYEIRETRRGLPGDESDTHSRYIEAFINGVVIGCLYLPNGNPWPGPKFDYKLKWLKRLTAHAKKLQGFNLPVALVGDYNIMPTDLDTYKPEKYLNNALFRPESRELFKGLVDSGWTDAIRHLYPGERVYTFWDYLRNAYGRNAGLRLDHFLLNTQLSAQLISAGIDQHVRGWPHSSDHAPAWIELNLQKSPASSARNATPRSANQ